MSSRDMHVLIIIYNSTASNMVKVENFKIQESSSEKQIFCPEVNQNVFPTLLAPPISPTVGVFGVVVSESVFVRITAGYPSTGRIF